MNKQILTLRVIRATSGIALISAFVCSPAVAAAGVVKAESENAIGLTNLDGPEEETSPAAQTAATSAATANSPVSVAKAAATEADKPDPLTQHRLDMLQQVKPDNYMGSNQATSRRYLMVDKQTYQARLSK